MLDGEPKQQAGQSVGVRSERLQSAGSWKRSELACSVGAWEQCAVSPMSYRLTQALVRSARYGWEVASLSCSFMESSILLSWCRGSSDVISAVV